MLEVKVYEVAGLRPALIGMRYALKSGDKSTKETDFKLIKKLNNGGNPHNKFLRQIVAWMSIRASLSWWKQADTYRMGFEKNSESTMHTIHKKPFEPSDFGWTEAECANATSSCCIEGDPFKRKIIDELNTLRDICISDDPELPQAVKDQAWREIIEILPESYMQERMCMISYATLQKIVHERKGHKLIEWHILIEAASQLPCAFLISPDFKGIEGNKLPELYEVESSPVLTGYEYQFAYPFVNSEKIIMDSQLFDGVVQV